MGLRSLSANETTHTAITDPIDITGVGRSPGEEQKLIKARSQFDRAASVPSVATITILRCGRTCTYQGGGPPPNGVCLPGKTRPQRRFLP